MKDLEIKLAEMQIPQCEDEPFEQDLRRRLVAEYYLQPEGYRSKFRNALAFCSLLLIFGIAGIIKPDLALKINNLIFRKNERIITAEQIDPNLENLSYTTIYNPNLVSRLDPEDFEEDKTYLIRRYVSSHTGSGLMIVSEYDQKNRKQSARRISY